MVLINILNSMKDNIRDKYCIAQKNRLFEALENYPISSFLTDEEFNYLINTIEISCNNSATREAEFNFIPAYWNYEKFRRVYTSICYRVNTNLDPESPVNNKYLGKALINFMFKKRFESYSADNLMKITGISNYIYTELANEFKKLDVVDPANVGFMSSEEMFPGKTKQIREEIELRRNQKIKRKTSSRYQCGNCKQRKTIIEERQTRSFDEAGTTFITCVNCDHRWTKG